MFKPTLRKYQIKAGDVTAEFTLGGPDGFPENVYVSYDTNTLSGSETLDFHGKHPGNDNYTDDVLVTQISLSSDDVKIQSLSAVGPLSAIKVTAGGIISAETVDLVVISW